MKKKSRMINNLQKKIALEASCSFGIVENFEEKKF
jgi:hypothetical protein